MYVSLRIPESCQKKNNYYLCMIVLCTFILNLMEKNFNKGLLTDRPSHIFGSTSGGGAVSDHQLAVKQYHYAPQIRVLAPANQPFMHDIMSLQLGTYPKLINRLRM
jgi:hypothetical protein